MSSSSHYVKYEIKLFPLCPIGRTIQFMLNEKRISYTGHLLKDPLTAYGNPVFGISSPVFNVSSSAIPVMEYLEEVNKSNQFFYGDALQRLEIRKICHFVENKMHKNATHVILFEKALNRHGIPNSTKLQEGYKNLHNALVYVDSLLSVRSKLSGDYFSVADIFLASHISSLDYMGTIDWNDKAIENVRYWYSAVKSRLGFRNILNMSVSDIKPPEWYSSLDF